MSGPTVCGLGLTWKSRLIAGHLDKTQSVAGCERSCTRSLALPFSLGPKFIWTHRPCGGVVWNWRALLVKFLPLRSGLGPSAKEAEAPKSYRVWELCSAVRPIILSHSEAALAILFFFFLEKHAFIGVEFFLLIKFHIGV